MDLHSRRFFGTDLENPRFAAIAHAMGAEGGTIDRLPDLGPALSAGSVARKEGKSTVLVTRELGDPFRRCALSKPLRVFEKCKAYL